MSKRGRILLGMAAGLLWSIGVIWIGTTKVVLPIFTLLPTLAFAFFGPGLVLLLLIGRIAQRRFFDDATIEGGPLTGAAEIDRRVLVNTVEQIVLALTLWPPIAYLSAEAGPGLVATLGIAFVLARVMFWLGYHFSPPLRAFGFAATFYPTVAALVYVLVTLAL